ncbi:ring-cleaving dioxygenase [Saliterribacillus persicus]|uniref:Glyoxalase family protein n=1 Tax=Saliterribacillus persicus TaxID=930114 RepID=A0A368XAI8_9BACI|nr:ring-cleaving dioxygenase [Saliterribacillus persicus]RCW64246.1 glyoxalase family protein [Saliterribacillus persicus]
MELKGLHHVSAITAVAKDNVRFYTEILGMRLVKKTVNQDDTSMYHLFYADEAGNPGTDLTFFEIKQAARFYQGNNSISFSGLRVKNDKALNYWLDRFKEYGVAHEPIKDLMGRKVIFFKDDEGQRLMLISDEFNNGVESGTPWEHSPVPADVGITGLGPVRLTVPNPGPTSEILTEVLGFRFAGTYPAYEDGQPDIQVYETGEGGTGAEVHVEHRTDLEKERPGRGSVHHVAFRVKDEAELEAWRDKVRKRRLPNSGLVDRYYFKSLYFREPNGILFELATDGPGFATDENLDQLGESLALPPFLEENREEIEANLTPIK